ncbi:MAG: hypothetical protein D6797_00165 [Bdellovibrio sp.]|nr:MAG: hypothetical protein D6797_00165 [Bdellovibrio sp.]
MKLFLLLLLFPLALWGQGFSDLPGLIPKGFVRAPATDLVYEGKRLSPQEAYELYKKGQDLSRIDPDSTTDLWNSKPVTMSKTDEELLGIQQEGETFEFLEPVASKIGFFLFKVTKKNKKGLQEIYTIWVGKTVHNLLLRKALLRKLGYQIQPIGYLKKYRVYFKGPVSKKNFLKSPLAFRPSLVDYTRGAPSRWVLNLEDKTSSYWDLQDALIVRGEPLTYSIALGPMNRQIIKGRRLLNALFIVYQLLYIPESVNLYQWNPGRLVNGSVYLPFEGAEEFYTSYEDARWILRRILSLSRKDFKDVVKQGFFPSEVEALVLEKLISRRNHLKDFFDLSVEFKDLPFDPKVSMGERLKEGKLKGQEWPGYGARFVYGDPASPLSKEEIVAFLKSKMISAALANLVVKVNSDLLPHTDVQKLLIEKQKQLAIERFKEFLKTGEVKKVPFGMWAEPAGALNLIASREVIAGSYLGTDNLIQLADAIGISADVGAFLASQGLPQGVFLGGEAKVFYNIIYNHLKPLKSIKRSLKEPFQNLIIPFLKKQAATTLDNLLSSDFEKLKDKEKQQKIDKVLKQFNELLGVGESFIVTHSLGAKFQLRGGKSLAERIKAQALFGSRQTLISRLHIFRKDKNTIQVYKDFAGTHRLSLAFEWKAGIQVLKIGGQRLGGSSSLQFHELDITPKLQNNPDLIRNLSAIAGILKGQSLEYLREVAPPFKIDYRLLEKQSELKILSYQNLGLFSRIWFQVQSPGGDQKNFFRYQVGTRRGSDYQSVVVDGLDEILRETLDTKNIVIPNTTSGNPGDTIGGRSVGRRASFEAEVPLNKESGEAKDIFFNIQYFWKGWSISKDQIMNLIRDLRKQYQFQFFAKEELNDTKEIQLYVLTLDIYLYKEALDNLVHLSAGDFKSFLQEYSRLPHRIYRLPGPRKPGRYESSQERALRRFRTFRNNCFKGLQEAVYRKAGPFCLKLMSLVEQSLEFKGFLKVIGGKRNLYVKARLNGFRKGDESGDEPLFSSQLGEIGSPKWEGPLKYIQNKLHLLEGEFNIYWILRRLR